MKIIQEVTTHKFLNFFMFEQKVRREKDRSGGKEGERVSEREI